ncbi:hypothetical protein AYO45_03800 [Gammaproteobacteria bacterium SCGC AG-212-F23]|nr:hypothetical protein AYO45_03800 [Gammaproteobacteria bacterium SCGC AG-212-F23]
MIKKILASTVCFLTSAGIACAAPYLGVSASEKTNTSTNSNFRGMVGTVSLGYGSIINQNFYFGGELFADLGTGTITDNTSLVRPGVNSTSVKTTVGYGGSLLPGLMFSEHTMGFLRLSLLQDRFSSAHSTVTGGQAGVGLQTNVTQCWDLRGEYDYTGFKTVPGNGTGTTRSDQFMLGLVYKFE